MPPHPRSVLTGSGSCVPGREVPNQEFLDNEFFSDYGDPIDVSETERVVEKFGEITGIMERRYADADAVASDLGVEAARAAIADAGVDPETLDYVIVAHNFGDVRSDVRQPDFCPTLAARIKARLGIENPSCVAYDLPFGCPGWLQAVIQADYFLRSGDASRALVIGTETLSRVSDPHDRDSMIYSDGAGAVVLEAVDSEDPVGILSHVTRSDTLEHAQLLYMDTSYDPQHEDSGLFLKMSGRKLYEYAVRTVPQVVKQSLDKAGLTLADVDKVLVHQANAKMDHSILNRLFRLYGVDEVPDRIMPLTVSWLGNSSVATIPTLFDLIRKGRLESHDIGPGDLLVFASVGAGMNINSMVYRCPPSQPS